MATTPDNINNITPNDGGENNGVFVDDGTCDWEEYFKMTTAMIHLSSNKEDEDNNYSGGSFDMYYISHYIVAGVAVVGVIVMMIILIGSQLRHRRHVENENRGSNGYDNNNNNESKPSVKVTPTNAPKRIETIEDLEEFDDKTVITRGFFFARNRSSDRNNTNDNYDNHGSDNKSRSSSNSHRPPKPIDVNVFLLVVATSWYSFWFAISHFVRALYFDSSINNDGDNLSSMKWMVRLYHVALLFSLSGLILIAYELEFQYSFRQMSTENGDSESVISNMKKDKTNNKKVFHFLVYVTFVLVGVTIGSILPLLNTGGDDMFFTGLIVSSVYVLVTLTSLMMVTYRILYHSCCGDKSNHTTKMSIISSAKDNLLFALCLVLFFVGSMFVKLILLPLCTSNNSSSGNSGVDIEKEEEEFQYYTSYTCSNSILLSSSATCPSSTEDEGMAMIMLITNILEGVGCLSLILIVTTYMIQ